MTYEDPGMASTNHNESFNLLLTGSDSCSDIPDFSAPKRKVRVKRKSRHNAATQRKRSFGIKHKASSICNSSCSTTISISLFMIVVAILMVLIWFIVQLRFQLDQLNTKFNTVEASNRGMPEELHVIHTKLNDLQKNYTLLKQKFNKLSDDALSVNKKILELQTTANNIKTSIAAAPLIKNLPDDVLKLTKNVASIGSKITNVEDKMEKLKIQHSDFDQKHKSFTSTIKELQNDIAHVKVPEVPTKPTQAAPSTVDNSAINQVHQNMKSLEQQFDIFNSSINEELKMIEAKTAELQELISTQSSAENQSVSNSHLQQMIHQYVNETVKKSLIVHIVGIPPQSSTANITVDAILGDMNSMIMLYVQLLSKFNQSSNILEQDAKSQSIIEELLNKIVHVPYNVLSSKIQNVSNTVTGLNSSVVDLKKSEANLSKQVEYALKSKQSNSSVTSNAKGLSSSSKGSLPTTLPSTTSKNKQFLPSTLSSSISHSSTKNSN